MRTRRLAAVTAAALVVGGYGGTQWVNRAAAADKRLWFRYHWIFTSSCAAMTAGAGTAVFLAFPRGERQ